MDTPQDDGSNEIAFRKSKKIIVQSSSSIFDLKAELFKKQQELKLNVNKEQLVAESKVDGVNKYDEFLDKKGEKKDTKSRWIALSHKQLKAKGVPNELTRFYHNKLQNKLKADEVDEELDEKLKKSREALIRKTNIYEERLNQAKNKGNYNYDDDEDSDDVDDNVMVNFEAKAMYEKNFKQTERSTDECQPAEVYPRDDQDWIEFTDSLGRSRRCLKQDMEYYQAFDAAKSVHSKESEDNESETQREEGEEEKPRFYETVRGNEIRDHGVGYFSFSDSADKRTEQMNMLHTLREQTKKQREQNNQIKLKRKLILKKRLEKIKQIKKLDVDINEGVDNELNEEEDDEKIRQMIRDDEREKYDNRMKKQDFKREWDQGKKDDLGQLIIPEVATYNSTVSSSEASFSRSSSSKERRDEREPEFAPPSSYSNSRKPYKPQAKPPSINDFIAEKLSAIRNNQS